MTCPATMESYVWSGHTHVCGVETGHSAADHVCRDCGRQFGVSM